ISAAPPTRDQLRVAPGVVVHHHDDDGDVVTNHRVELSDGEADRTVPGHAKHWAPRIGEPDAHCQPQADSHRAQGTVGEVTAWPGAGDHIVKPVLGEGPVPDNDRIRAGQFGYGPGHLARMDAVMWPWWERASVLDTLPDRRPHLADPRRAVRPLAGKLSPVIQRTQRLLAASDDGETGRTRAADLLRIALDVDDPRRYFGAEPGSMPAKAHPQCQHEIGLDRRRQLRELPEGADPEWVSGRDDAERVELREHRK